MATIRKRVADSIDQRADGLESRNAPAIMVEMQRTEAAAVRAGTAKIKGLTEFGELEIMEVELKTGRGGKPFARIITAEQVILFFPAAKYGPFLTIEKTGEKP